MQDVSKNRVQKHNVYSERTHEITLVGCTFTSDSVIHLGMPRVCVCDCYRMFQIFKEEGSLSQSYEL